MRRDAIALREGIWERTEMVRFGRRQAGGILHEVRAGQDFEYSWETEGAVSEMRLGK
jgi:hypothetical protein